MNCLCLPSDEQGGINGKYFSEYRNPMKEVLKGLVAQAGMTNIVLRRRITRLIFVLSNDAEKKEEVAAVKAKAVIAATRNLTPKGPKKERVPFDNKIEPIAPPVEVVHVMSKFEAAKHIADCISGIRSAKTPGDVEKTISALPASGFGDSVCLRELLEGILDNTELVNNSKVRRRVKRLIETLSSSSSSSDIVKVEPEVESDSISKPINEVPSSSAAKVVKPKVAAVVKPVAVVIPNPSPKNSQCRCGTPPASSTDHNRLVYITGISSSSSSSSSLSSLLSSSSSSSPSLSLLYRHHYHHHQSTSHACHDHIILVMTI
jgi:hypothetical protein